MIHKMVQNRYDSVRDDGRRVEMMKVACQETRVQLPKGHSWSTSHKEVTCHECLKVMIQEFVEKASFCNYVLRTTKYVKPSGFRLPRFVRGSGDVRFEPDPEILERISRA